MLLGDNVLVKHNGVICRPSDIGNPVTAVNTWTIRFNNGISIVTTGNPKFRVKISPKKYDYYTLDNISGATDFGYYNPMVFPNTSWNSVIHLSEFTSATGDFDLNNNDFIKFAMAFGVRFKKLKSYPGKYILPKQVYEQYKEYMYILFPIGSIDETDSKYYVISPCWVTELFEAIFDISNKFSIPDEFIYNAPKEWLYALYNGLLSVFKFSSTSGGYLTNQKDMYLISDIAAITQKIGVQFVVSYYSGNTHEEKNYLKIRQVKGDYPLIIVGGKENLHPMQLYDVGNGDFDVCGILMRD